jgi:hypothetical protein
MSTSNKVPEKRKFREKASKVRLAIGLISLAIGFLAANLALFQWVERAGLYYLLGSYARYVCAYGGFFAMIFGAMLISDFINRMHVQGKKIETTEEPLKVVEQAKKRNNQKRITKKVFSEIKSFVATITPTALILMATPIALSAVSYTATVTIIPTTMPQAYYLHRIDLTNVTPPGKLMNSTPPPRSQQEILYELVRGETCYFYSPPLPQLAIQNGTWHLYIWASTASSGKTSKLTIQIHIVSSDGNTEKSLIGSISDIVIDYGYFERDIQLMGNSANISQNDRIRLTIHVQTGSENDPKGINFYYDGYGTYQTPNHETRMQPP